MTPEDRVAFEKVWRRLAERFIQIHREAKPIIDYIEAQKNDPTRKRYPTSGDALSTRKHRPRRTR